MKIFQFNLGELKPLKTNQKAFYHGNNERVSPGKFAQEPKENHFFKLFIYSVIQLLHFDTIAL